MTFSGININSTHTTFVHNAQNVNDKNIVYITNFTKICHLQHFCAVPLIKIYIFNFQCTVLTSRANVIGKVSQLEISLFFFIFRQHRPKSHELST